MSARTALLAAVLASTVAAGDDFPKFEDVAKDYAAVPATSGGAFMTLHRHGEDAQLLGELPKDYDGKHFYVVATVGAGDPQAGVYSIWHNQVGVPARTLYWTRRGKKLALVEPNLAYRSSGDAQSKAALERVYTDRVVTSVPILTMGPGGGPVIDLDALLVGGAGTFFGAFTSGANTSLARITDTKVFPHNVEVGFEMPRRTGQLAEIRYSIGMPPKSKGFVPREADRRVGIYHTEYTDRAKNDGESQIIRYANRWHIEKADPSLSMSPPKKPIVYHIEHTTPIRYRRWVRDGILAWNKAFEQVGIVDAIEVRQQDAATGAYMDVDPSDITKSFVRWTNSSMGFAIGPVHYHPDTGEIYEADIVMDEGFISSYANQFMQSELASAAMGALHPDLAPWLAENPNWDPRVRLASPKDRPAVLRLAKMIAEGVGDGVSFDGAPPTMLPSVWAPHAALAGAGPWSCAMQPGLATSVAQARLALDLGMVSEETDDGEQESLLDGLPESFVGPLLRDVIMHEVGHTMGMMHNWKGSALYDFAEINSADFRGAKSMQSTVMDYAPANIVIEDGDLVQGDYGAIDLGPYDMWAIEWNYTFDDPKEVAARSGMPEHAFMAEDGAFSPDPRAKTWDLGKNSLDYADAKMDFVRHARAKFLDEAIEEGDSWQKARDVFGQLLGQHMGAVSVAAHWVGGAHLHRSMIGDEGAGDPVVPVDVAEQRRALRFIVDNAFDDEAFGLSPELLRKLGSDNWYDDGFDDDHDWPVNDQVLGIQSSVMTMLLNPVRLRRVQDNELRTDAGDDALTVPEVLHTVRAAIWAPLDASGGRHTNRDPMISSFERHCQSEHLRRLVDLARGMSWSGAAGRDLSALARAELRTLQSAIEAVDHGSLDDYSRAHLDDCAERILRALTAEYERRG